MATDRELLQMALDVMEAAIKAGDWKVDGACDPDWVLNALRAALAQPEPVLVSPKEFISAVTGKWDISGIPMLMSVWPVSEEFTEPPQREWQGLTAKDLTEIPASCYEGAIWADAKLKEKNND